MKKSIYNNLMANISNSVKQALNEAETNENKNIEQLKKYIAKYIKGSKIVAEEDVKEPYLWRNKSSEIHFLLLKIKGEQNSVIGIMYLQSALPPQKLMSSAIYNIAGDIINIPSTEKCPVVSDGKNVVKLLNKFSDHGIQGVKNFMYNYINQQFNWNTFIKKVETKNQVSPEVMKAAKKLYKDLVKYNKNIPYALDFAKIINPHGDLDYEGVLLNDVLPLVREMYNKNKNN